MQRGARFAIFVIPFGAPSCAQRGRRKHYQTNVFLMIFKMKGTPGAAIKWIPQKKKCKIYPEKKFFASALGALWHPLGVVTFLGTHAWGVPMGP